MLGFLLQRVVYAATVLFGVTSLVFALVFLAGDPLSGLVPPGSSPEQRAALARAYGLDRPIPEQYAAFLGRVVHGDFGASWRQGRPALSVVVERLPASLALVAAATALGSVVGVGLGVAAGWHPGGVVDAGARLLALGGQAIPAFWLGTLLIWFVAVPLRWLPPSGFDGPASLVLPAVTLAVFPAATLVRLVRTGLLEQRAQDYVRTARGKGLPERRVLVGHALGNALLPALAYIGLQAGFLLGGAVVVEAVFGYPGIGGLALAAVADRDLPLVQAFVAVVGALVVGVNLVVEVAARWLDPRQRDAGIAAVGAGA